jgi:hypothetical protein
MTAEEFESEKEYWDVDRYLFAEAYAKHENSYAILAIDEFKKENEDLQKKVGLAKSVEVELRKTIGKFKPLQKQVEELKIELDKAYKQGFNDGNQRDFEPKLNRNMGDYGQ